MGDISFPHFRCYDNEHMSTRNKVILITLLFAVPALLLGRQIWPPAAMSAPDPALLPYFIVLSVFESLAFGLGISFLFVGWPLVQKISGKSDTLTKLAFVSIAWYLVNWWPHDNMHAHIGMDMQRLLYIEYSFHVTMIIAAAILAYFFFTRVLRSKLT
jgi:hypothetical protein